MSKSAAQRLAVQLAQRNFLWRNPEIRQYRLGLRLLELGALVQTQSEVLAQADPLLRSPMRATVETVHLAWLDGYQALCAAKLESTRSIRMSSRVGYFSPLHCTSAGKALLAFQSSEMIEQVIARGLPRVGPNTIFDTNELHRKLADVRVQGFALDLEEREPGLCCVAVPVHDASGSVFSAISVAGPVQRLPSGRCEVLCHGCAKPPTAFQAA